MSMTDEDLKALAEAAEKATPGPWKYRPDAHDDWGYVKGPNDGAKVAVAARGAWDYDEVAPAHRAAKTDPFEHNAAYIALANPAAIRSVLARLHSAESDLAASRAETARLREDNAALITAMANAKARLRRVDWTVQRDQAIAVLDRAALTQTGAPE